MPADIVSSTTQQFLDIHDITNNFVIMKDGTVSVILTVSAMNFGLLAEEEQDAIMYAYAGLLNSLNYPIQILIHSQTKDVTVYLQLLKDQEESASSDTMRHRIRQYREFVSNLIHERNVLDKKFYVTIPATALELGILGTSGLLPGQNKFDISQIERSVLLEKAQNLLDPKRDHLMAQFARIGLFSRQLSTQEIIQLFYVRYNPEAIEGQQIAESRSYTAPLVQASIQGSFMSDDQPTNIPPSPANAGAPPNEVPPTPAPTTEPTPNPAPPNPVPAAGVGTQVPTPNDSAPIDPTTSEAGVGTATTTNSPNAASTTPQTAPTPSTDTTSMGSNSMPDAQTAQNTEPTPIPDPTTVPEPPAPASTEPQPDIVSETVAKTSDSSAIGSNLGVNGSSPEPTSAATGPGPTVTESMMPIAAANDEADPLMPTSSEPTGQATTTGTPAVTPEVEPNNEEAAVNPTPNPNANEADKEPTPDEKEVQADLNKVLQDLGPIPATDASASKNSDSSNSPTTDVVGSDLSSNSASTSGMGMNQASSSSTTAPATENSKVGSTAPIGSSQDDVGSMPPLPEI